MLALGTAGFAVIRPQLARTFIVPLSSMQELERGLYVDSQMPEAQRQQLRSDLAGARSRVAALFGNPLRRTPRSSPLATRQSLVRTALRLGRATTPPSAVESGAVELMDRLAEVVGKMQG